MSAAHERLGDDGGDADDDDDVAGAALADDARGALERDLQALREHGERARASGSRLTSVVTLSSSVWRDVQQSFASSARALVGGVGGDCLESSLRRSITLTVSFTCALDAQRRTPLPHSHQPQQAKWARCYPDVALFWSYGPML